MRKKYLFHVLDKEGEVHETGFMINIIKLGRYNKLTVSDMRKVKESLTKVYGEGIQILDYKDYGEVNGWKE